MHTLFQFTGTLIDTIKINRIAREEHNGSLFWVKRRRGFSRIVVRCANRFFRAVQNPVIVCSSPGEWQQWEVSCFNLLHGPEGYRAEAWGDSGVCADLLPGEALHDHAFAGTLTEAMLRAAGRELRRAHTLKSALIGGRWSHGDPHLGNFIYDAAGDRARLIDFEVYHRPGMSESDRHTDDLLVTIQDLMGRADFGLWRERVEWFLEGYRISEPLLERLATRLNQPVGLKRLWWAIRTGYLGAAERRRRITALREWCRAGIVPLPDAVEREAIGS